MEKNRIIDEIKLLAKRNGGKPPGQRLFLSDTGIKPHQWQKYFARWGDALKEAGFSGNVWQGPLSESFVLDRIVELIRDLGHFPVKGELLVKRNSDPTFPSVHTFRRKFQSNQQIASAVLRYIEGRDGFEDVQKCCEQVLSRSKKISSAQFVLVERENFKDGFVYLIKSGKYYKIGRTNAVGRRTYELGIQLPEKPRTVHTISTDDPEGIEAYWHKRFEAKRKNGEWFDLSPEDVQAFRRRKFM